jgi:hypothetical protein
MDGPCLAGKLTRARVFGMRGSGIRARSTRVYLGFTSATTHLIPITCLRESAGIHWAPAELTHQSCETSALPPAPQALSTFSSFTPQ